MGKNKSFRPRLNAEEMEILQNFRLKELNEPIDLEEIRDENVKLAKQRQLYMDSNRIERAAFRNDASGPVFYFIKSRAAIGSNTIVGRRSG